MNTVKVIFVTLFQLAKQVWLIPQTYAKAVQRQRQEAERLDRIRNPSKYVGK